MTTLTRRAATLGLAFGASACAIRSPAAEVSARLANARLNDRLKAFLDETATSAFSGVLLISQGNQTSLAVREFGSPPISRTTRFWIGSIGKPITAAAVIRLQEQGRLSVDDPIARFFDAVPTDKRGITVRHLLTHGSGLPSAYAANGVTELDLAAGRILALTAEFAPGAGTLYSNDGYNLLAMIVQKASGEPFERYVKREVLDRAGLSQTGFWPTGLGRLGFAPVAELPPVAQQVANWGWRGSGGVYSTADDLHRFMRAYRDGRILSAASVTAAMSKQVDRGPDMRAIGYGWFIEDFGGGPIIQHSGAESVLQHNSWLQLLEPTGTVLVLLSNSPEDVGAAVMDRIVSLVASDQAATLRARTGPA